MLRSLTSLATSWTAYRLLRQDARLAEMSDATAHQWASCIPLWTAKLPTLHLSNHRSWMHNMYRHGHRMTDDKNFWTKLQQRANFSSNAYIDILMEQAGLFGNPMPFVHFEPYEDPKKDIFGETRMVTGNVAYMRATFNSGTHPDLGQKLVSHGFELTHDLSFFSLPIRGSNSLFGKRENNTENYWTFFIGEPDFPISRIIDYYQSILNHDPSDITLATWSNAAWNAKRTNTVLQKGSHWGLFESQIRPLFEKRIDWELIAACQGFLLSMDNSRNCEIAWYAQQHLMFDVPLIERSALPDAVALGMLTLAEPTTPWEIYTLFSNALTPGEPIASYPLEFS